MSTPTENDPNEEDATVLTSILFHFAFAANNLDAEQFREHRVRHSCQACDSVVQMVDPRALAGSVSDR